MLHVIDLSNHQAGTSLTQVPADAYIFKATEGTYFVDKACDPFVQQAKKLGKPYGVYHFLDQSDVVDQAHFFLQNIKGYIGEALLVLDYQGYGKQGVAKAKLFLETIYKETGVRPLIYMNESDANEVDWRYVIADNYGLWIAKYSAQVPNLRYWPHYAMWQYTSSPVDKSYFYGDLTAWKAYAKKNK